MNAVSGEKAESRGYSVQCSAQPSSASNSNPVPADPLDLCKSALEALDQGGYPLEIAARLAEVVAMLEAREG